MTQSAKKLCGTILAVFGLFTCSTPHEQTRGPDCSSGASSQACRLTAPNPDPDLDTTAPEQELPVTATGTEANTLDKHFMIQVSNYQSLSAENKKNRLFVYTFATNPALGIGQYSPPDCRSQNRSNTGNLSVSSTFLAPTGQGMERLVQPLKNAKEGVVAKMLIFSSVATAEAYLAKPEFVADLKASGIAWLGYNMEGDKTPPEEMCSVRGSNDASNNAVVRFAKAAKQAGFKFIWGPIRNDLDKISDSMVIGMCEAGMSGFAMQEQNTIQAGVDTRINAIQQTIKRYRQLCGKDLYATVQIMSRSCGEDSCQRFANGFIQDTKSIAIWATGSEISNLNQLMSNLSSLLQ